MSQLRLVDISQGKPVSTEKTKDNVRLTTDCLWPYHVSRIAIDTWVPEGAPNASTTPPQGEDIQISTSLDGKNWTVQKAEWLLGSKKSTLGSGPTYVALLKENPVVRFAAIQYVESGHKIKLRCLVREESLLSDEKQKYSMGSLVESQADDVGVVLVGGSNTVMRYGWSKALSESPTRVSAAAALGASSNIFAVRTLSDHPNPQAEVLLYNANVIEYPLMKFGDYDFELARDATKYVLGYCHQHRLYPVNVIWPEQDYIDAGEAGDFILAADTYFENLSRELSMPFIDGYRVLKVLQMRLGRPRESLFRDQAHLNHFAAQLIGRAISKLVGKLKSEHSFDELMTAGQLSRAFKTIDIAMNGVANDALPMCTKNVSNSLITQEFVELEPNRVISIGIDQGWEVVGYLINARHCNASIKIEGERSVTKRAAFKGFNPDPTASPFVCARALSFPIRPTNGTVSVSLTTPAPDDAPDMLLVGEGTQNPEEQIIELGQLILRSLDSSEERVAVRDVDLDLTSRVIENLEIS